LRPTRVPRSVYFQYFAEHCRAPQA
jgi:hypothetical protein